jgi:hypothetical protein
MKGKKRTWVSRFRRAVRVIMFAALALVATSHQAKRLEEAITVLRPRGDLESLTGGSCGVGNAIRKATHDEMAHAYRVIRAAFPDPNPRGGAAT